MARIKRISVKLGNMRKAADWVVYPASRTAADTNADGSVTLMIQSDHRIATFNSLTGAGLLSKSKSGGAYFMHLSAFMGATPVIVPADVIALALDSQPKSGDEIGPGVTIL